MDFANSLLQLVENLWGLARRPLGYICNLKNNVNSLRKAKDKLEGKSKKVLGTVEREERGGGVQRTEEVVDWLDRVHEFVGGVNQVLQEARQHEQIKCLSHCLPPNCRLSYNLGKKVYQMLMEVRDLQTEGEFSAVTSLLPPPLVLETSMYETVGLDISKFNEVWKWVVDEKQVGMVGLYGTGGVGKTTFMRRIEKELSHANNRFDVIIWVVVSNSVNKDRIQDTIRRRLGIIDEHWEGWPWDEKVHHLCQALSKKKFVLLLDDLWAELDIFEIGVPYSSLKNGSKVMLTTRLAHVCDQMRADKILEVQCLMKKEAMKLFENNVGKSLVDCDQEIRDLAKDIAEECKGLPLALITVGQAMARKDHPRQWRHALTTLKNNPYNLSSTMEKVYHILEFSYDSLPDSTCKACFLYCCLFPEDYPMITDELIELWIGEGLLGDIDDDVYLMRSKGEFVLGDLKSACLLESGQNDSGARYVKMHDVIRDMATWITRDHGERENKLLVIEKQEDMLAKMISKWGEAEKVSLWGKWIQNIDQTPLKCSQLKTLFVRETNVRIVPIGFFHSMVDRLTVLDLSGNRNIELFPEEICNMISLQYLNLSATHIHELPREIKKLTRLRWLLLDFISSPALIPTGAITSLPLNVFSQKKLNPGTIQIGKRMVGKFDPCLPGQVNEKDIIEELGHMQHLTDLSINVSKSFSTLEIFQSLNLQRCIRIVRITDCEEALTRIPIGTGVFSHLEGLYLLRCHMLREMEITQGVGRALNYSCFPNLVEVWVEKCGLLNLSWLVHASKLRRLIVMDCDSMEKIIGDGFAAEELPTSGLFSCLQELVIMNLPKLTSIYDQTLPSSQLILLAIVKCPRLRKLPVDSSSTWESLHCVWADAEWLAELEWEDGATRANFTEARKRAVVSDIELRLIK